MPSKKKLPKPFVALSEPVRHDLERRLGHIFHNPDLLGEALEAAGNGTQKIGNREIEDGNKRLALLGDTILKMALLRDWFASGDTRRM